MNRQELINEYRNKVIIGQCIDLVPLKEEFLSDVIRLRNQKRSIYFLNQGAELTLDMQKKWYEEYLNRDDDIYWCVRTKDGVIIGTIRLYNIKEHMCDHGSIIIDENYSMGMPYALETELLSLEVAFNEIGLDSVVNEDRVDNSMMNSITKKMGFEFEKEVEIRGVIYNRYVLHKDNSKVAKYRKSLDKFMER